MIAYQRRVPIAVTKHNDVPQNKRMRSICPKCGEFSWERVYVPYLFTKTRGLQVWRCSTCKDRHIQTVEKDVQLYHRDFFGDVTGLAARIMGVYPDLPCPSCLGRNLSPMADKEEIYLECDVCDEVIRGDNIPVFFDIYSKAHSLAGEYADQLTPKEYHYLMLVLYLYIMKYPDRYITASLITRVYPQIPVHIAAKLVPMAATLLGKK